MSISPILKARRQKEKDALKKKILTVAKKIAVKEGWNGVTIRRIAAEIQYSLPVIYSHFKDKAEIIFLIAEEGYEKLSEVMDVVSQKEIQDLEKLLLEYCKVYYNFGVENPAIYQAMYGYDLDGEEKRQSEQGNKLYEYFLDKIQNVEGAQKNLDLIWSSLYGLVSLTHLGKISTDKVVSNGYLEDLASIFKARIA